MLGWDILIERTIVLILQMPVKTQFYDMPGNPYEQGILDGLFRADEALSKIVERARLSDLGAAWAHRLLYRNACAAMQAQQCLIYLEDLVLLDGHAFAGVMSPELSCGLGLFKFWETAMQVDAASLLRADMPGETPRLLASAVAGDGRGAAERPDFFWDPDWDQAGRIQRWREVWRATDQLHPLLAAGIVWDAWHTLQPEQQGTWRSTLLAALVLRARAKTRHLLLPLDTGQKISKKSWSGRLSFAERMAIFLDIAECAIKSAGSELDALIGAKERMLLRVRDARKNSRVRDLIDLMMARPLVSIPLAVKELGLSKQALRLMIGRLGSTAREITDRRRYRYWTVP